LMRNQSRAVQTQSIKYSFECQFEVVCVSQTGEPVLDLEPIEAEILCHGNIPGQGLWQVTRWWITVPATSQFFIEKGEPQRQ
jgi:hypothetical protein